MSRAFACELFALLLTREKFTVKRLADELETHESNVRDWLYELQRRALVDPVGNETRPRGTGRGLSTSQLWQLRRTQ